MDRRKYIESTSRTIIYAFSYVFLDWLFLVTKPSFLGAWPLWDRFHALFAGTIPFVAAALALHLPLCGASLAVFRTPRLAPAEVWLERIVPALIAAATVLILVDNFTYTVFGRGIVDTTVVSAPAYWLLSGTVFVLHIRRTPMQLNVRPQLAGILILACGASLAWSFLTAGSAAEAAYRSDGNDEAELPNIVMFAADGVPADRTSAYGYRRRTTPNLDRHLDRALIADNAFTNSGWTTSSVTSMMTGKNPATTKVLYPPYTLRGVDAHQHLPGILRRLGYTNLQESLRYYADGPDLNWVDSFEFANGRAVQSSLFGSRSLAFQAAGLLSERIYNRITERVKHLLFIAPMTNTYAAVVPRRQAQVYGTSDADRMSRVHDFIRRAPQPFFVHIHLMETHCCDFHPRQTHFSAGGFEDEAEAFAATFDDAILDSDRHFGEMMDLLAELELLENTLVVYSSDHTLNWDFRSQVPLIFMFPGAEHQERISAPAQLLDVAPTILDHLNVEIPDWMEGRSLLRDGLAPDRPIYSIFRLNRTHFETDKNDRLARVISMGPPTYDLDEIGMVVCQRWYTMRLLDRRISSGIIETHRDPCPDHLLPGVEEAREMMSRHLRSRGFQF